MSKTIMKYLLALCLICNVGNAFAQHRYYCEVKGIEKDLSSGLKIIFDFGKPIIHWIFYKDAKNMDRAREGIMTKTEYQKLKK